MYARTDAGSCTHTSVVVFPPKINIPPITRVLYSVTRTIRDITGGVCSANFHFIFLSYANFYPDLSSKQ